jgi:hypothetical protein
MAQKPKDDPSTYPALGRALTWVDKPGSDKKIVWALIAVCLVLFLLDFTYEKHGEFKVEFIQGFYAFYGFVMFTGLILAVRVLRYFIKRPEDYYGDKAVDPEEYPTDQLEIRDNADV